MKDTGIMVGKFLLPNLIGYRTSMFHKRARKTRPNFDENHMGFVYSFPSGKKDVLWLNRDEITETQFQSLPQRIEA